MDESKSSSIFTLFGNNEGEFYNHYMSGVSSVNVKVGLFFVTSLLVLFDFLKLTAYNIWQKGVDTERDNSFTLKNHLQSLSKRTRITPKFIHSCFFFNNILG